MDMKDWEKDMPRCVLNQTGRCLARIPEACACAKMPKSVCLEAKRRAEGGQES